MTAEPHTIWWWDDRDGAHLPVPNHRLYDTRDEAVAAAKAMVKDAPSWLAWVKVFRADNEAYEAFRWSREDAERQLRELLDHARSTGDKGLEYRTILALDALAASPSSPTGSERVKAIGDSIDTLRRLGYLRPGDENAARAALAEIPTPPSPPSSPTGEDR